MAKKKKASKKAGKKGVNPFAKKGEKEMPEEKDGKKKKKTGKKAGKKGVNPFA